MSPGGSSAWRDLALGALVAGIAERLLTAHPPGGDVRWRRSNHRGREVSLLSGPALAAALAVSGSAPVAVAVLGAGAIGAYDDSTGARHPHAKGFRGHAAALRQGRLTGGAVKVFGIGAVGLLAARLAGHRDPAAGAVVAASANLVNLFDLRPGRALKVGALAAVAMGCPRVAGAATALLPGDLREQTMLGDAGANALGAALGLALLERTPPRPALAVLVAVTAVSEVVSYSRVIDAVPALRWVDRAGRLP